MASFREISLTLIVFSIFGATCSDVCVDFSSSNPCLCVLTGDSKIDLSNLVNKTILNDTDQNSQTTWYFSGCRNSLNNSYSLWKNVTRHYIVNATTQHIISNDTAFPLGQAESAKFIRDPDQEYYQLAYINKDGSINASIRLLCDKIEVPYIKIYDLKKNTLILSSPEVCPKTIENHGLSSGSVFLLLLFITAVMYFIGGGLVLYFIRGARGIEVIPNVDFWKNLPGLVKDGVIYLLSGCRPTFVSSAETYDRI